MGVLDIKYFQIISLQSIELVCGNFYGTKYYKSCATFKLVLI
jgi:hypothetical protein